jgi:hypothetical protein
MTRLEPIESGIFVFFAGLVIAWHDATRSKLGATGPSEAGLAQ